MTGIIQKLYSIVENESLSHDQIERLISELEDLSETTRKEEEKLNMALELGRLREESLNLEAINS